jgi:hypothetical protein
MSSTERIQDESDAPTRSQVYVGLGWTRDILVMRMQDIRADIEALQAAHNALAEAFDKQSMAAVKQASEAIVEASKSLRRAAQNTHDDASVLARKAREHLTRSARI